jgi:hypothetical protein
MCKVGVEHNPFQSWSTLEIVQNLWNQNKRFIGFQTSHIVVIIARKVPTKTSTDGMEQSVSLKFRTKDQRTLVITYNQSVPTCPEYQ